ncbi:MAG TPA: GNAT family N-acetyltransferase [Candidatus Sulfotelmatobacter sp.]|nr:GNAT family N-acetyltransferase [Candidatus Sulfotelmatobacter sp.]
MSLEPGFRLAVESDADVLLEFVRAYYDFDGHGFDREKARKALTALLRDAQFGRAWLILDGASAVGYVVVCFGYSLEWLGRDAFVDEFYLQEQYRGHGWGQKTMAFVENAARAEGIRTLHLEVVRQNAKALELYRRLGFREHHSTFLSKWIAEDISKPQGRSGH